MCEMTLVRSLPLVAFVLAGVLAMTEQEVCDSMERERRLYWENLER
jgi:hypothetical protein